MFRPHIQELPPCKAVASGWKDNFEGLFDFMGAWIQDKEVGSPFTYPDFLMFHEPMSFLWLKLLPDDKVDTKGFEVIDFLGGLYVSAIAMDDNIDDLIATINDLNNWVKEQDNFELDFRPGRYRMTSRLTSDETSKVIKNALGYDQLEVYLPIKSLVTEGRGF